VVDALVIGAGVCGLTTAVVLAEQGLNVDVYARETRAGTASWAAGAIWCPLDSHHPDELRWGETTRQKLLSLSGPDTGVREVYGLEACRSEVDPPHFLRDVEVKPASLSELPEGYIAGWRYSAPVINMPVYLEYLHRRLTVAGGRVVPRHVDAFSDDLPGRVVVNCTGVGARALVPDETVTPVRGRVVIVENPGIDEFFAEYLGDETELTYILPLNDRQVVLGSTYEKPGTKFECDDAVTKGIVDRCANIFPELHDAQELEETRAGDRCIRSGGVRLEHERIAGRDVIHNYGHNSGGVSLSWGCAAVAGNLVARYV
jgi:D-amino-acid oxidase